MRIWAGIARGFHIFSTCIFAIHQPVVDLWHPQAIRDAINNTYTQTCRFTTWSLSNMFFLLRRLNFQVNKWNFIFLLGLHWFTGSLKGSNVFFPQDVVDDAYLTPHASSPVKMMLLSCDQVVDLQTCGVCKRKVIYQPKDSWLAVWNIFYFSIYWE